MYWYAEPKTMHTTFKDGLQLYEFENGQVEKHYPDGTNEITFSDGTVKYSFPNGEVRIPVIFDVASSRSTISTFSFQEESIFPDGRIQRRDEQGVRTLEHPDGSREVVFANGVKQKSYSNGTVRTQFEDGRMETRYKDGRCRVKDAEVGSGDRHNFVKSVLNLLTHRAISFWTLGRRHDFWWVALI